MSFERSKIEISPELEEKGDFEILKEYVNEIYEKSETEKGLVESFKEHNETVLGYARELGKEEGISSEDLDILITAAILHDVSKLGTGEGKEVPLVKHGWESAAMAEEKLKEMGREKEFIKAVKNAIERHMGSIPGFMQEQAKRIEFPRPETLVEKILYDADMLALMDVQGIEKIMNIRKNNEIFAQDDRKTAEKEGITREEAALRSALKSGKEAAKSLFTDSAKEKARDLLKESEEEVRKKIEKENMTKE